MRLHIVFLLFSMYLYYHVEALDSSNVQKAVTNEILNVIKNRQVTPENAKKFLDNLKDIDWKEFAAKEESVEMKMLKLGGKLLSSFEQSFPPKSKKVDKKKPDKKKSNKEITEEVDEAECKNIIEDENGVKYCGTPLKQQEKNEKVEPKEEL